MKKLTTATTVIIAIVLILIAGGAYYLFGHGTLSKTPMLYGTDQPDGVVKGFLETMIPHHIESVDASRVVMSDASITVPEVRVLAARLSDTEEFEIGQMKSWYREWFFIPVPLFIYKPTMKITEAVGDEKAKVYLNNMIAHYEYEISQAQKARKYIEAMQANSSDSDGQLTITNSHVGIDTTILFTRELEAKRTKDIADIKAVLLLLK